MEDTGLNTQETRNLIESSDFREILGGLMEGLNKAHSSSPGDNLRWKRSPQDRLLEKSMFNADCIIEEFQKISRRTSNLSSSEREFIKMLVYKAMNNTLISRRRKYNKEASNGKEE